MLLPPRLRSTPVAPPAAAASARSVDLVEKRTGAPGPSFVHAGRSAVRMQVAPPPEKTSGSISAMSEQMKEMRAKMEEDESTKAMMQALRGTNLNDDDSAAITDGLSDPGTFMFTAAGDVQCNRGGFQYINPTGVNRDASPGDVFNSGVDSIAEQKVSFPIWGWDDKTLMCLQGRYILRKENGRWHLLYNFFHTKQFRDYWLWHRENEKSVGGWGWNGTIGQDSSTGRLSMASVFGAYCSVRLDGEEVDWWGVGLLVWELLTGRQPYRGRSSDDTLPS